jgi:hypothetical protein
MSKSVFGYYIWQHVYSQIIALKKHDALETYREDRFLEYIRYVNYQIPVSTEEYLRSVGLTKDKNGIEFKIALPVWPKRKLK